MMKKVLCALLVSCLICFGGCGIRQNRVPDPVSFYYPRQTVQFNDPEGVITAQIRSGTGQDIKVLLDKYLSGPHEDGLRNPFPRGTRLVNVQHRGAYAEVTLSDAFLTLKGLDLTLACSCITLTVAQLLQVDAVTVRTADGEISVTMYTDQLLLSAPQVDVKE